MKYSIIQTTKLKENCILIWCKNTKKSAIIDPGGDDKKIIHFINENNLIIEKILLTHGHLDHVGAALELSKYYNIKIFGPQKNDSFLFKNLDEQSKLFDFPYCKPFTPSWLEEGNIITIGDNILKVYHSPGHTPGHIIFFNKEKKLLFSGDILFKRSIGSTSFWKSNFKDLMNSIHVKILTLGDDVIFIPGHGLISNILEEKLNNPFL